MIVVALNKSVACDKQNDALIALTGVICTRMHAGTRETG
jgi:hypothetical protein